MYNIETHPCGRGPRGCGAILTRRYGEFIQAAARKRAEAAAELSVSHEKLENHGGFVKI